MAVQGSGLGAGPDPKMVDQQSYDARKGAPKHAQTSFPVKDGMKDQNAPSGVTSAVSPIHPGVGPDASAADVMDPESPAQRGKTLKRQSGVLEASWGMDPARSADRSTRIWRARYSARLSSRGAQSCQRPRRKLRVLPRPIPARTRTNPAGTPIAHLFPALP